MNFLIRLAAILLIAIPAYFAAQASEEPRMAISCKDYTILYLAPNGERLLTPEDFVVGDCPGCTVDVLGDTYEDLIDCAFAGKTVSVMINVPGVGQPLFCSAMVLDITPPEFISCGEITVGCHLDVTRDPIDSFDIEVSDGCGIDTIFPIICGAEDGDCVTITKRLKIQWQAIDSSGNVATCIQNVSYRKESVLDVNFPADDTLYCGDTGMGLAEPFLGDSTPISKLCGLIVGPVREDTMALCGASFRIDRSWTVIDLCNLETMSGGHTVFVLDTMPPIIDCPINDTIPAFPGTCVAGYIFPDLVLPPACPTDDSVFFATFEVDGELYFPGSALQFDTGTHVITLVAADACWNADTCRYNLVVVDQTRPVIDVCFGDTLVPNDPLLENATLCSELDARFGGPAQFSDDCCGVDTIYCSLTNLIDAVQNTGDIVRRWWAIDSCGNVSDTCMQVISVMDVSRSVQYQASTADPKRVADDGQTRMSRSHLIWGRAGAPIPASAVICTPNPFDSQVTMRFECSAAGESVIQFTGVDGRLLRRLYVHVEQGLNEYTIAADHSWPEGVLFAHISTPQYHQTIRLIHLRD